MLPDNIIDLNDLANMIDTFAELHAINEFIIATTAGVSKICSEYKRLNHENFQQVLEVLQHHRNSLKNARKRALSSDKVCRKAISRLPDIVDAMEEYPAYSELLEGDEQSLKALNKQFWASIEECREYTFDQEVASIQTGSAATQVLDVIEQLLQLLEAIDVLREDGFEVSIDRTTIFGHIDALERVGIYLEQACGKDAEEEAERALMLAALDTNQLAGDGVLPLIFPEPNSGPYKPHFSELN